MLSGRLDTVCRFQWRPENRGISLFRTHCALSACPGAIPSALSKDVAGKHALNLIDTELLVELFLNRRGDTQNPDFQIGIEIKSSACLNTEVGDALVWYRTILHLASGQSLFI